MRGQDRSVTRMLDDARADMQADARAERDPPICKECGGNGGNCPGCWDDTAEASPYCRCDNLPSSGEVSANRCSTCGRPLK